VLEELLRFSPKNNLVVIVNAAGGASAVLTKGSIYIYI
jgi:hypothetical protein